MFLLSQLENHIENDGIVVQGVPTKVEDLESSKKKMLQAIQICILLGGKLVFGIMMSSFMGVMG